MVWTAHTGSVVCENITENRFECATSGVAIARFWRYWRLFFWASSFFVVFIDHLQLLFNWNLYEIVMYLSRTWQLACLYVEPRDAADMWCGPSALTIINIFVCHIIRYDEDVKHASTMWHRRIYFSVQLNAYEDNILKPQPSSGRMWMSEVIFQNRKSILIKVESSHNTKGLTDSNKKLITFFFGHYLLLNKRCIEESLASKYYY